ncbi:MAG: hypothetical protein ABIH72_03490 [archaeon]
MNKEVFLKAIKELKDENKSKKRKFNQSVDLIVNLRNFDIRRESVNLVLILPFKIKDAKVAGFLNNKSNHIDSITKAEFEKYKDKKEIKKLVKKYDFFIASAKLMPEIATNFGKYLGPSGKMPTPQLGIIAQDDESSIKDALKKFDKILKVRSKEPSIKLSVANQNMKDEEIVDNLVFVFNSIINVLPRKKENIKNVMIKLTMSKPIKLVGEIKQ